MLADTITAHIRFEERELFNYLEQILSKDELDKVFLQLEAHPVAADEEWKDEFWVKK